MERPSKVQKQNHTYYGRRSRTLETRPTLALDQQTTTNMQMRAYPSSLPGRTVSMDSTPPMPGLAYSLPSQFNFQYDFGSSTSCGFGNLPAFSGVPQPVVCGPETTPFWPVFSDGAEMDEDMMTPPSHQGLNTPPPPAAAVSFEAFGLEPTDFCSPGGSYPSTTHSPASYSSCTRTEETAWSSNKSLSPQETLPQTQKALARIYQDLRYQQDNQSISSDQAYHKAHSQELFTLVLSLWTNLRSLTLVRWDENQFDRENSEVETTFKLSFMAINVVLDMYKAITISSRRDLIKMSGKNNSNNNRMMKKDLHLPSRLPHAVVQPGTPQVKPALDAIVRLTVMECHLVGLEQIFQKLDAVRNCREILTGSRLSVADFQSMRIVVTGLIDDLKKQL